MSMHTLNHVATTTDAKRGRPQKRGGREREQHVIPLLPVSSAAATGSTSMAAVAGMGTNADLEKLRRLKEDILSGRHPSFKPIARPEALQALLLPSSSQTDGTYSRAPVSISGIGSTQSKPASSPSVSTSAVSGRFSASQLSGMPDYSTTAQTLPSKPWNASSIARPSGPSNSAGVPLKSESGQNNMPVSSLVETSGSVPQIPRGTNLANDAPAQRMPARRTASAESSNATGSLKPGPGSNLPKKIVEVSLRTHLKSTLQSPPPKSKPSPPELHSHVNGYIADLNGKAVDLHGFAGGVLEPKGMTREKARDQRNPDVAPRGRILVLGTTTSSGSPAFQVKKEDVDERFSLATRSATILPLETGTATARTSDMNRGRNDTIVKVEPPSLRERMGPVVEPSSSNLRRLSGPGGMGTPRDPPGLSPARRSSLPGRQPSEQESPRVLRDQALERFPDRRGNPHSSRASPPPLREDDRQAASRRSAISQPSHPHRQFKQSSYNGAPESWQTITTESDTEQRARRDSTASDVGRNRERSPPSHDAYRGPRSSLSQRGPRGGWPLSTSSSRAHDSHAADPRFPNELEQHMAFDDRNRMLMEEHASRGRASRSPPRQEDASLVAVLPSAVPYDNRLEDHSIPRSPSPRRRSSSYFESASRMLRSRSPRRGRSPVYHQRSPSPPLRIRHPRSPSPVSHAFLPSYRRSPSPLASRPYSPQTLARRDSPTHLFDESIPRLPLAARLSDPYDRRAVDELSLAPYDRTDRNTERFYPASGVRPRSPSPYGDYYRHEDDLHRPAKRARYYGDDTIYASNDGESSSGSYRPYDGYRSSSASAGWEHEDVDSFGRRMHPSVEMRFDPASQSRYTYDEPEYFRDGEMYMAEPYR